jgi:hypothetical protein
MNGERRMRLTGRYMDPPGEAQRDCLIAARIANSMERTLREAGDAKYADQFYARLRAMGTNGFQEPAVEHYLEPLATRTPLKEHVRTAARVIAVSRVGFDKAKTAGRESAPFELRYRNGGGAETLRADAVVDASGTWSTPNPAGINGIEAIGEVAHAGRIAYGMPDVLAERLRYAGKVVAVVGAGHSAVGTILDLVKLKDADPETQVIWLLRGERPEKPPARAAFGGHRSGQPQGRLQGAQGDHQGGRRAPAAGRGPGRHGDCRAARNRSGERLPGPPALTTGE